jgi:hypothetical protein
MKKFLGENILKAKQWIRENWGKGCICPCCGRIVKKNPCNMSKTFAEALRLIYENLNKNPDKKWIHSTSSFLNFIKGGELGKLAHWGLIEARPGEKADGNKRNGFWTITEKGKAFVENKIKIIRKLYIYNGRVVDQGSEMIGFNKAMGIKFHYNRDVKEIPQVLNTISDYSGQGQQLNLL